SATGAGLLLGRQCQPGESLVLFLPLADASRAVHADVVRAGRRPDCHWLLGCSFAEPLADGELQDCRGRPGILVVDDEPAVGKLLQLGLGAGGFTVRSAGSGREALAVYGQGPADIAAVLLDVQMPDLDGPQTLAALRQINPDVRACFMSGDLGKYSAEELLARGAARLLRKPFVLGEVVDTLWEIIKEPAPRDCR